MAASPTAVAVPRTSLRRDAARWLETIPVPRAPGFGRDTSLLIWSWIFWGFGMGLWNYLWPVYLAGLGASSIEVGIVVGTNSVVATLCYLPGGYVARLGHHRWQLTFAHFLPIVSVASFGLARDWWHVLPGMVGMSLVALVVPAVNSFIAQIADDDGISAPRVFTVTGAALYAAMAVTPPLGGWIGDRFGMGTVFPLVSLCYAASVSLMAMLRSRPMPDDSAEQAGASRRGALSAGSGAYRDLLAGGAVRLFLLTAFLTHGGMHLALSFGPLYLGSVYGWDSAWIGWVGSAASAGTVVMLLTMERFRRRRGAVTAMFLATGSVALHFACVIASPAVPVQAIGFLARGGFQTVATLTTVALTEAVSRGRLAPAIALLATVSGGAAIVTPPLGGWLFALDPRYPFLAAIAMLLASAPLVYRTFRTSRQ